MPVSGPFLLEASNRPNRLNDVRPLCLRLADRKAESLAWSITPLSQSEAEVSDTKEPKKEHAILTQQVAV